ncbi:ubiquinone/menaquinone biosynthesis C-methylase UbiE [Rhizobium sp. BK275]|uniref:class I SAM-dependent methyltransferase n=1 Tax=Rhizobium sp. BK275 TaxID=2587077 RepID=UPI00160C59ED|nr:class I SAM-dependent methyltransferase [Rhizobium sp. BK275]MBB3391611.1 ubiquinone/menaquinone biosynthesis C-methylase UbiE [Rhizobium sp. BK275]
MPSTFIARGAEAYEASMGRWSRRLADPFLAFAGVPSHGRVLDAGCGTGSLTLALSTHPELTAIEALDFEENFVAALRARTDDTRISARQGDVCALPYEDKSFDAAYSLLVLHFVSNAEEAITEMRRVLKPGATAAAAVWSHDGMPSWRLFWNTIRAIEPEAEGNGIPSGPRPMTAEGELRALFESAGFADVAEARLTMIMDYANFEDFYLPKVYGQGRFSAFFEALPEARRERLREALKAAYLDGRSEDGPRGFESVAWAVRGTA